MLMLARAGAVQQHLDLPPEPSDLGFWVWLQTPKPGAAGRPDIIAAAVIRGPNNASISSAPATTTTMAIRSFRRLTGVVIDASFASNVCPAVCGALSAFAAVASVVKRGGQLDKFYRSAQEKEISWAKRCGIDRNKKAAFAKSAAGK